MKIGIIGAGRVGFSFGKYLVNHNYDLIGYYSRTKKNAIDAAIFTNTECYESLNELVKICDILFLTVNDDSIKDIVNDLKKIDVKDKIICHTSGALSSDIIDINDTFNYSIHPIMAFPDKYSSYISLEDAHFTIEGNKKYISYFLEMFKNVKIIKTENKELYHAMSSLASNNINGLLYLIDLELKKIDLSFDDFKDLFFKNASNINELGYYNSLTGPIERNDLNTIKKHVNALSLDIRDIYIKTAKAIAKMKERTNIYNYLEGVENDYSK